MCFKCDELMDAKENAGQVQPKKVIDRAKVDRLSREITERLTEIVSETGSPYFGMKMVASDGEQLGAVAFGLGPVGTIVGVLVDELNGVGELAGMRTNSNVIPHKPQGSKPGFIN